MQLCLTYDAFSSCLSKLATLFRPAMVVNFVKMFALWVLPSVRDTVKLYKVASYRKECERLVGHRS